MSRSLLRRDDVFVDFDDTSNFMYWRMPVGSGIGRPVLNCRKRVLPSPELSGNDVIENLGGYYEYFYDRAWIRKADRDREAMYASLEFTSALVTLRRVYSPGAIVRLLTDYSGHSAGDLLRIRYNCFSDPVTVFSPNVYATPLHVRDESDETHDIGPYWWRLALDQRQPTQIGRVLQR